MKSKKESQSALIADLIEEYESLDQRLASLEASQWSLLTPFRDWTVFDTVAHLWLSERLALEALTEPVSFAERVKAQREASAHVKETPPDWRGELSVGGGEQLRARWRADAGQVALKLIQLPAEARIPWYGPSMSVMSFAAARLMETWAHGETLHDALRLKRNVSARLWHVCDLGWRTRAFAQNVHGLPRDDTPIRLTLEAPDGKTWSWGEAKTLCRITGSARDFARVVCQCRHVRDTRLVVEGEAAVRWMSVAQCFAGGPVSPPPPGTRKTCLDGEDSA